MSHRFIFRWYSGKARPTTIDPIPWPSPRPSNTPTQSTTPRPLTPSKYPARICLSVIPSLAADCLLSLNIHHHSRRQHVHWLVQGQVREQIWVHSFALPVPSPLLISPPSPILIQLAIRTAAERCAVPFIYHLAQVPVAPQKVEVPLQVPIWQGTQAVDPTNPCEQFCHAIGRLCTALLGILLIRLSLVLGPWSGVWLEVFV